MISRIVRFRIINVICSVILIGFSLSCKKKNANNNEQIPNSYVNINIYKNTPEFFPLNTVGGWIYKDGGVKGVVIYRASTTDFVAFERSCPHDGGTNTSALVKVLSDNTTLKDTICGSQFLIMDGSVLNGPSGYPLRAYHATFDGDLLHVYN
jgi:nitrite reductase/ring-hydroxylating ferredoxin subunit